MRSQQARRLESWETGKLGDWEAKNNESQNSNF